jgi:hypothetical protein
MYFEIACCNRIRLVESSSATPICAVTTGAFITASTGVASAASRWPRNALLGIIATCLCVRFTSHSPSTTSKQRVISTVKF